MGKNSVHEQAARMRQMLLDQGYLDDQFAQLEQLENEDNPHFAREIVSLYFQDSEKFIQSVERCMEAVPVNFNNLDRILHQLKGSSASIGANKVKLEVNRMRDLCSDGNVESCKEALQNLKRERADLKDKMDNYFQLLSAKPADDPMVTEK